MCNEPHHVRVPYIHCYRFALEELQPLEKVWEINGNPLLKVIFPQPYVAKCPGKMQV
jgi:hypothetical protein